MDEPPNKPDETKPAVADQKPHGTDAKPDVPTLTRVKTEPSREKTGNEVPTLTNVVRPAKKQSPPSQATAGSKTTNTGAPRHGEESSKTPPQEDPAIPTLTRKFQPSSDTSPDIPPNADGD